jgi:hypothetical protein
VLQSPSQQGHRKNKGNKAVKLVSGLLIPNLDANVTSPRSF